MAHIERLSKVLCFFLICFILLVFTKKANAQSTTNLTYDVCGNRIAKKIQGSSPNPAVTSNPQSVTLGQTSVLTASGCPGIIQWSTGQQGTPISVTPSSTNFEYTAECITPTCSKNGTGKISVNVLKCPPPAITVTANYTNISPGQQVTLSATGCQSDIKWISDRSTVDERTTNVITVQPTQTTYYTALCTQIGCNQNMAGTSASVRIIADCQVDPISVFVTANPVRYGQIVNLIAYDCIGTVQWSTGGFGSTTSIQVFGTDNIVYAICKKPYCPNSGTVGVTLTGVTSTPCTEGDVLVSTKDGNWNDASTWQCGRIPTITDDVYLKNTVTVSANGNARKVIYGEGYLVYQNNAFITYPQ